MRVRPFLFYRLQNALRTKTFIEPRTIRDKEQEEKSKPPTESV